MTTLSIVYILGRAFFILHKIWSKLQHTLWQGWRERLFHIKFIENFSEKRSKIFKSFNLKVLGKLYFPIVHRKNEMFFPQKWRKFFFSSH
jgi:hypothetical protein